MAMIETRDGTRLYVKDWGQGRPVVLLHGWPLSSDTWDDTGMALAAAGHRVIAYDRRGFSRSEQPWSGYDYDTLADDLADVLAATGAEDAALIGFSMGGGEVARYLSRHGSTRIWAAGLVASVVPYMLKTTDNPDGTPQEVFDDMAKGMKEDRAHFFADFFKTFYGKTLLQGGGLLSGGVSDEVVQWSCNLAMQASLKATLACAESFATTDFRPDLTAFTMPTLIIHGTADKTVPIDASARAAARGIANSQLVEYEGGPHGLQASHKERLTADLLAFLR
ncbi:arylesterase [Haematobacter massiliensis]|uniref:Arylesterase n=1 Tax=Haematobacter massiliensis TaxID=195105 RepID=A0A086Y7Y3_9RHOB|nr:alpha/beta hydrolase [Haematobacter massiliensis]KFI30383.1 arylesterase [Haematobacter massiliensis]OWJ87389.1 alpha/beta hydrolase [Haematobacter massiliensis]QBJ24841.1 alpha/beta hydrolase [Haematobacter massiliensis]